MLRKQSFSMVIAAFSLVGCLGSAPSGPSPTSPGGGATSGSGSGTDPTGSGVASGTDNGGTTGAPGNTFDHPDSTVDPFEVLRRIQSEGPPEVSTRMHACQKMKYATVGRVLGQLGVNLGNATANSAGALYKGAAQSMGAPNYGARVAESIELTTAGATKLFDIFVQAAPEIVTAMPKQAACNVAGAATSMFDAGGKCTAAGISCLQGAAATQAQIDLCNNIVGSASSAQIGQTMAVATLLSAAHTCE